MMTCIVTIPLLAQQHDLKLSQQALAAHDYPTVLTHTVTDLPPAIQAPGRNLPVFLAFAIALERTGRWTGGSGEQVIEMCAANPDAARYLRVCRALAADNLSALPQLFDGPAPETQAISAAARLAREHGCPIAADALTAVTPGEMPGLRVKAWLSVPEAQRSVLDELMPKLVAPVNLRMLATSALDYYIQPPVDPTAEPTAPGVYKTREDFTIPAPTLLAFARQYANGLQVVSFKTAERLLQQQRTDDGLAMAREVAAEDPADPERQRYAARLFQDQRHYADAGALLWAAVTAAPSPETRTARLNYLEFRARLTRLAPELPGLPTLDALRTHADPLLAADASLYLGKPADAAPRYRAVADDPAAPLPRRLEAWSGLLDSDPAQAFPIGTRLLAELKTSRDPARPAWLRWMGWTLARALQRAQRLPEDYVPTHGQFVPAVPLTRAPGWEAAVADAYHRLVDLDAGAVLPYEPTLDASLRVPIAAAYLLHAEPQAAAEILLRPVTGLRHPPLGGWKTTDGVPTPDTHEPRPINSPSDGEWAYGLEGLCNVLRDTPAAAHLAPFTGDLAQACAEELKADRPDGQVTTRVRLLLFCLRQHAAAQDPPAVRDAATRPRRTPDLAAFARLDAALRDALARDTVAKQAHLLWIDGFQPALLTVRDPQLVEGYFQLLTLTLDRHRAVTGQPAVSARAAAQLAKVFETTPYPPRPDLKPYAKLLRERYPLP